MSGDAARAEGTERAALPRTLGSAVRVFFSHASPRILAAIVLAAAVARAAIGDFSAFD
ncbi:MAG: hypothetical protein HKP30_13150, partial [Myxococcales bacterium]|nr:hypothetical protein [Myxococcales bacterium]